MDSNLTKDRRHRPGYSLVELLFAAAIVALLLSMLSPTIVEARRQAKDRLCVDKLSVLAEASRMYAEYDDYSCIIPVHHLQFLQWPLDPTFIGAYEYGGKSGIGFPAFLGGENPVTSKYGSIAGYGPHTRPLNAMFYPGGVESSYPDSGNRYASAAKDAMVEMQEFCCPADSGPPPGGHCWHWLGSTNSSYDHFGTSYAANVFMIGNRDGSGTMKSNSPYLRPVSRIPLPARTLLYEENIGRWAWAAKEDPCDWIDGVYVGPTGIIPGWHGKDWTYNRAFVDGHVARQTIIEPGTEDKHGYARHYRIEVVFPHIEGEPYQLQDRYECFIVRGHGWAKDTLPAAPIDTGLCNPAGGMARASYEYCVHQ